MDPKRLSRPCEYGTGPDDPRLLGEPDASPLDRSQCHEIAWLIDQLLRKFNQAATDEAVAVLEDLVHTAPPNLHTQKDVFAWMVEQYEYRQGLLNE
jgi:hypothetical protein